jgi:hypothetical protein
MRTIRFTRSLALGLGLTVGVVGKAQAAWPDDLSTRALGMGGALRGAATGDAGPMLNPSGMGLARNYALEARYQLSQNDTSHRPHFSIVDSTSAYRIAGGLYYTYLSEKPGALKRSGHEAGASLAIPFGSMVFLGGQLKYLRLATESQVAPAMGPDAASNKLSDYTFDVGITVRPAAQLSLGAVAYNVKDLKDKVAPFGAGLGVSFAPLPVLTMTFDTVFDFTTYDDSKGTQTSVMGGVEFMTDNGVALRAGGGKSSLRQAAYVTAGASALSEMGAVDIGFSRDISGDSKYTVLALSVRLFAATPIDPG